MLDQDYSVGDLFVMGFAGFTLSPETIQTIQREKISNFILFGPNYEVTAASPREQLIAITDHLQSFSSKMGSGLPFVISADQEGGRVQRFRKDFTLIPNAKAIGDFNSPNVAFEISQVQARELYAAGIQLNYAPVCDINTNPANPVIGDRAYGATADVVTRMSSACVRGHLTENVEACIKHFPGHGDTHTDSHLALPTVTTNLETLRKREWIPFHRAMKSGSNYVMSAHVMLPELDAERPGTFSSIFLRKYLRKELQFQGVIVSDDMQMQAVTHHYGKEEAPVLALEAGCDLLCYRSESETLIAIEAVKKALTDGRLKKETVQIAIDRNRKVKKGLKLAKNELSLSARLALIGNEEHQAVAAKVTATSATNDPTTRLP